MKINMKRKTDQVDGYIPVNKLYEDDLYVFIIICGVGEVRP